MVSFTQFVDFKIGTLHSWTSKKLRFLLSDATIITLTGRMSTFRIRTMPILENKQNNNVFSGIVTQADIAKYLPPNIDFLPISVLRAKNFDFTELREGSKAFESKTIADVFEEVLNLGERDRKIAVIDTKTTFLEAINQFTEVGIRNRRYRTLVIYNEGTCNGVLSYIDVFNIFLSPDYRTSIEGFLRSKIKDVLPEKSITFLTDEDSLANVISIFDNNPFTHIPVSSKVSNDIIGLVDDITARSLQYDVIYDCVEDMQLKDILEIQRPNFKDMTILETDTIEDALKKFTQSKTRPKTLLIGTLNSVNFIVSGLSNTLSYVDVMRLFLTFAKKQMLSQLSLKVDLPKDS